ncbi:MAG: mechanosensitive ion channel family protein [Candidatus Cloacimonetes bacterium]|nr:mechanosensitive ion channel family protein [Candidatus Cloacimonadota bacterium]
MTLAHVQEWFHVGPTSAVWFAAGLVLVAAALAYVVARLLLLHVLYRVVRSTRTDWDDILMAKNVPQRALHVFPLLVIYYFSTLFPQAQFYIVRFCMLYATLVCVTTLDGFLSAVDAIYNKRDISRARPIKGVIQIVKILIYLTAIIIGISVLVRQSPIYLLSGLGAMTAVLLLVFKDTILGFVAGLQLSLNNLVQIGDWLEVPQYGADGLVIDVALYSVQIQNWDMTITIIPTYKLMEGSFKNWRGMQKSGGRRIMRSVIIDMNSIRFCDEKMLKSFGQVKILDDYMRERIEEVNEHNSRLGVEQSDFVNARRLTNIGTFRAYLIAWLQNHPRIRKDMTFLVRQLKPSGEGLPIEIYVFADTTVWGEYEDIQAHIFDHVLSIVPFFGLRVYQQPTGSDILQGIEGLRP